MRASFDWSRVKYQVFTAVNVVEADSRLEAVDKFCNGQVVILVEEYKQEGDRKIGHEFIRSLNGCKSGSSSTSSSDSEDAATKS